MIEPIPENAILGLVQRDAAMISLIAHAQTLMTRLAMLTQNEKDAVLALVAIGQALTGYAHAIRPDREVLESFGRTLETLSPEFVRRVTPHSLPYACREPSGAHDRAVMNPRDGHEQRRDAEGGAAAEVACVALHLKALYAVLAQSPRHLA